MVSIHCFKLPSENPQHSCPLNYTYISISISISIYIYIYIYIYVYIYGLSTVELEIIDNPPK